jgi:chorismate mutase
MLAENEISADRLVCAFFSATPDLDAAFPAQAARQIGWTGVPLFGTQELAVRGAPERCLRVMLLAETPAGALPARHVYLRGAQALRPDVASSGDRQVAGAEAGATGAAAPSHFCSAQVDSASAGDVLAVAPGGLLPAPSVSVPASFFGFYFYRR